jgi:TPR repeat protein
LFIKIQQIKYELVKRYANCMAVSVSSTPLFMEISHQPTSNPSSAEAKVLEDEATFQKAISLYESDNYSQAIPLLEKGWKNHHPPSTSLLGLSYITGSGVPQDPKRGFELLQEAAEGGDNEALCNLAVCYLKGVGVPQDPKKAVELFQKAISLGNTQALLQLARCYLSGAGVPQDQTKAIELFERAYNQKDARAATELGSYYERGAGVPQSFLEAAKWYQKAADLDDAEGTYLVAKCYERGIGVLKDEDQAKRLKQKASDLGHPIAIEEIGRLYHTMYRCYLSRGEKVESYAGPRKVVDRREAFRHYLRATNLGNASAREPLLFIQNHVFIKLGPQSRLHTIMRNLLTHNMNLPEDQEIVSKQAIPIAQKDLIARSYLENLAATLSSNLG